MTYCIYALINETDHLPFYIGMTGQSLKDRLEQHLLKAEQSKGIGSRLHRHLRQLRQQEKRIGIIQLQECSTKLAAYIRELVWIGKFLEAKAQLHNSIGHIAYLVEQQEQLAQEVLAGGAAQHGKPWSDEEKKKLKRYVRAKLTNAEMALLLGRTETAVERARDRDGV